MNAAITIVFSIFWVKLSDTTATRKSYLVVFFAALSPIFVLLGFANSVTYIIILYALLAVFTSSIPPVAVMYAIERRVGRRWHYEVARFNSAVSLGIVLGLAVNTLIALFFQTAWLFYISAGLCLFSTVLLWRTIKEPEITLERKAFPLKGLRNIKWAASAYVLLQHFDVRRLRFPRKLSQFKPFHLLFSAFLLHWIGIIALSMGEAPLMRRLGLSRSAILFMTALNSIVVIFTYVKIAPKTRLQKNGGYTVFLSRRLVRLIFIVVLPLANFGAYRSCDTNHSFFS